MAVCGDLVPEGSVYRFLAVYRKAVSPDGMFEDLFGPRGRPSVPGSVVATVMVLQALEGLSESPLSPKRRRGSPLTWRRHHTTEPFLGLPAWRKTPTLPRQCCMCSGRDKEWTVRGAVGRNPNTSPTRYNRRACQILCVRGRVHGF